MGSLAGHLVPGTFFLLFSIWWSIAIFKRYFKAHFRRKRNSKKTLQYKNTSSFLWYRSDGHKGWPLESCLKLGAVVIGMTGELATGFDPSGTFGMHNGQHMTMFAFFGFNAVFELMYHFRVPALPPQLEYAAAAMAFGVEGLLFLWHLDGRPPMDVQVHTFLIYVVALSCVATIAEMMCVNDVRPALARSGFTFLQGTWFYQIGFTLYPPKGFKAWDEFDHRQMMFVTLIFTWHLGVAILFHMVIGVIIYRHAKATYHESPKGFDSDSSQTQLLGETKIPLHVITESDAEDTEVV